ncbi:proline-rich transmembrane 2 isoform x1 [Pyrenophora seminiperda CCB06]|uniref:Proline-rich transmembrane 2 isoform x1 n=1 Tax=Pyrenophora seminiperda CCB06 TaxID=1302712 RepID=A0A3M7M1K0_9PLEO|nr:proline-rich transmembrane 2 isoform x1 [Pyrenophora seminiperda CCB06]
MVRMQGSHFTDTYHTYKGNVAHAAVCELLLEFIIDRNAEVAEALARFCVAIVDLVVWVVFGPVVVRQLDNALAIAPVVANWTDRLGSLIRILHGVNNGPIAQRCMQEMPCRYSHGVVQLVLGWISRHAQLRGKKIKKLMTSVNQWRALHLPLTTRGFYSAIRRQRPSSLLIRQHHTLDCQLTVVDVPYANNSPRTAGRLSPLSGIVSMHITPYSERRQTIISRLLHTIHRIDDSRSEARAKARAAGKQRSGSKAAVGHSSHGWPTGSPTPSQRCRQSTSLFLHICPSLFRVLALVSEVILHCRQAWIGDPAGAHSTAEVRGPSPASPPFTLLSAAEPHFFRMPTSTFILGSCEFHLMGVAVPADTRSLMSPNGTLLAYSKPVQTKELRDQAALISMAWKEHCAGRQKLPARAGTAADSSLGPALRTLTIETQDCNIIVRLLQPELLLVLIGRIAPNRKQTFKISPEGQGDPRYPETDVPSPQPDPDDATDGNLAPGNGHGLTAKNKSPSLFSNMSQREKDIRGGALHVQRKKLDALAEYVLKDFEDTSFVMPADADLQ